jgi:hypothetical protein
MSNIPPDVLESAREMLQTIARKLTDVEIPAIAKLEQRERETLLQAIFQGLDFAYQEGYGDAEEAANDPMKLSPGPPKLQ